MDKQRSEVKITFSYTGFEETPDELSEILGIKPTHIMEIGSKSPKNPNLIYKKNYWGFQVTDNVAMNMPDQLDLLLEKLNPLYKQLVHFSKLNPPVLEVVIKSYNGDEPLIMYSRDVINFLSDVKAETIIDLYIN